MPGLVRICAEAQLPAEGAVCEVEAQGQRFCVTRVGGQIAVLDGVCSHNEGPLGEGIVENGRVVCPWHGWAFDVKTGEEAQNPRERVWVFQATIGDGALSVRLP